MKEQFAKGLFIKNDDNGVPCYVGDTVKVSVGEGKMPHNDYDPEYLQTIPPKSYTGILVLLKSKGIAVRCLNDGYIQPRLTKNSLRKWEWELLKHA